MWFGDRLDYSKQPLWKNHAMSSHVGEACLIVQTSKNTADIEKAVHSCLSLGQLATGLLSVTAHGVVNGHCAQKSVYSVDKQTSSSWVQWQKKVRRAPWSALRRWPLCHPCGGRIPPVAGRDCFPQEFRLSGRLSWIALTPRWESRRDVTSKRRERCARGFAWRGGDDVAVDSEIRRLSSRLSSWFLLRCLVAPLVLVGLFVSSPYTPVFEFVSAASWLIPGPSALFPWDAVAVKRE